MVNGVRSNITQEYGSNRFFHWLYGGLTPFWCSIRQVNRTLPLSSYYYYESSLRYGRRPIMGASFVLMFISGIICALAPEDLIGKGTSYPFYAFGRFLLACATRGISITGFVIGMYSCLK